MIKNSNNVTTKIEGPEKTVSDADETNVKKNTVRSLADDLNIFCYSKDCKKCK